MPYYAELSKVGQSDLFDCRMETWASPWIHYISRSLCGQFASLIILLGARLSTAIRKSTQVGEQFDILEAGKHPDGMVSHMVEAR